MALITLTRAKEFIPNFPDDDDTVLTSILNASSELIEKWCNRTFASETYDQLYDGTGYRHLLLEVYPILSISRIATSPTEVIRISNAGSGVSRATVRVTSTGVVLTSVASAVTTTTTLTFATYTTLSALATAVSAVSGWTATATDPYSTWASADLRAVQGAFNAASSRQVGLIVHTDELSEYSLREDIGEVYNPYGFSRGYKNWRVVYTAGFTAVPEPIQQACAELAAATYNARNVNPNLQSESLGQYSYTVAAQKGFEQLSVTARRALELYRVRRVPQWEIV